MKRHAFPRRTPAEVDEQRRPLVEQQLTEVSRLHITAARDRDTAQQQAAVLAMSLRWLLLRSAARPARVLDTGTPGVEVTR